MIRKVLFFILFVTTSVCPQDKTKRQEFELLKKVAATEIKSQDKTGTCWAFATASFIESELLRLDKGKFDLSEMFIVRNAYKFKTEKYFRYHGEYNLNEGGQAHDFLIEFEEHGILPENIYPGKTDTSEIHNHQEMWNVMKGIMDAVVKKKVLQKQNVWPQLIDKTLDLYLGDVPASFTYNGKNYTPAEFGKSLGINPQDYIELTSFTNHPFYEWVDLEVPDNYRHKLYYNLPLDEFMSVIDYALNNDFSVAWDGSMDKDDFKSKKGYGVVEVTKPDDEEDSDSKDAGKEPEIEKVITTELRQQYFDSFKSKDDHLMHLIGLAKNQNGTKFYYVKNSWGTKEKGFDGYYYLSDSYMRLRTIAIMVHKDALPKDIRTKLKPE